MKRRIFDKFPSQSCNVDQDNSSSRQQQGLERSCTPIEWKKEGEMKIEQILQERALNQLGWRGAHLEQEQQIRTQSRKQQRRGKTSSSFFEKTQ